MKTIETVIAERVDGLSRFEFQDAVRAAELAALACAVAGLRRSRDHTDAGAEARKDREVLATIARLMGIDAEDVK